MSYRFPLATVLRVREIALAEEERAFERIEGELRRLRDAVVRTDAELREVANSRQQVFASAALPAMHLHASYGMGADLRLRREALLRQIGIFEKLRAQQSDRYRDALVRRDTLTELRDCNRGAWTAAQAKREQQAIDDSFLAARHRREK